MATSPRPRLTPAEGRRFAWTLAAGLAALGGVAAWRHSAAASRGLLALAAVAVVAGALIPTRLGPVERAWTALGMALSRVTSPLFYSALYFLVLTPAGILRRVLGRSPLARARTAPTFWVPCAPTSAEAERDRMERQF